MSTEQKPTVAPSVAKETPAQPPVPTTTTAAATSTTTEVTNSSTTTSAPNDKVAATEENDHKVFVGNLSFQTKEEGLVSFFETSGKVLEAKIITIRQHRFKRRSAGYGFVTFATLEDATKAAQELNKKELDGREINVEVARPKPIVAKPEATTNDTTAETEAAPKQRKRRARKNKNKKTEDGDATEEKVKEPSTTNGKKANKATTTTTDDEEQAPSDASEASSSRARRVSRRKRNKNKKKAAAAAAAAIGEVPARTERRRVKKELTEPSKTTLFVANLPYASVDETLKEVFKDYKVKSAHVARMRNGRSKGYGFVDLETEEEQLKALENVKDVELEGRTIYLKIALSERPRETEESKDQVKETDATNATPATEEKLDAKKN
ncbi:uncharacterized protein BX664DRAFT_335572 [Halteromyces radiatus]|uniref:uncharacterized protein n=1 Tax=Halteromyces radiatus TaxID=101107 RepID=UPI00221E80B8|nr:uncharacterized protein BX664DRAFT_335572 [Halteromyces radiatus]KAI8086344.1 hypothetical protein BX664DRAFT_335572 [Halteromyces radiatus]